MKSLRDYKIHIEGPASASQRTDWGGPFSPAIYGTVKGVPVRGIVPGDMPGASTVILCADPNGFLTEVKRDDFIVTDGTYLPLLEPPAVDAKATKTK